MTLENILADFRLLDDWEDRHRYVIELGRFASLGLGVTLPPARLRQVLPLGNLLGPGLPVILYGRGDSASLAYI